MNVLKVGDIAPDFSCKNQYGELINLSEMKGKKIVIFFYPKANTCLLYTSPSPRDAHESRMPSSA